MARTNEPPPKILAGTSPSRARSPRSELTSHHGQSKPASELDDRVVGVTRADEIRGFLGRFAVEHDQQLVPLAAGPRAHAIDQLLPARDSATGSGARFSASTTTSGAAGVSMSAGSSAISCARRPRVGSGRAFGDQGCPSAALSAAIDELYAVFDLRIAASRLSRSVPRHPFRALRELTQSCPVPRRRPHLPLSLRARCSRATRVNRVDCRRGVVGGIPLRQAGPRGLALTARETRLLPRESLAHSSFRVCGSQ